MQKRFCYTEGGVCILAVGVRQQETRKCVTGGLKVLKNAHVNTENCNLQVILCMHL